MLAQHSKAEASGQNKKPEEFYFHIIHFFSSLRGDLARTPVVLVENTSGRSLSKAAP